MVGGAARCYTAAVMPLSAIIAALVTLGIGEVLKRLIIRKWSRIHLHPNMALFPRTCPVCLSPNADSAVDEESGKRQTAYYVVAQKLEWWKASVPHCSTCADKLFKNRAIGLVLGGVCVVVAFWLMPPTDASSSPMVTLVYILFGYPAYAVADTIQKGVVFGRASSTTMCIHVRHREYFARLAALNNTIPHARMG